jgi:RNA 3'-terminal phosphate cyclase (ATP)
MASDQPRHVIHLDGSLGEGGGQVLRTALGLSAATGQPFRIDRIRAQRSKPGLQRQHLTAVLAAAEVCGARVDGAELGSPSVAFRPGPVRAGDYRFAIGTAGSTTLVLQTVLPALLCADGPSTIGLHGGTHNPLAPPFDFLQLAFAPLLARMGARLDLQLLRHGFAPAGGGRLAAHIAPPATWRPLELRERGHPGLPRARALLASLPDDIGRRELAALRQRLGSALHPEQTRIERVDADGPGNALLVELPAAAGTEVVAAFGERGLRAEAVAERAADEVLALLAADVPVGPHLVDQLLIPLALAGGGSFRTLAPTPHATTNAQIVERFLPVRIVFAEDAARRGTWLATVDARP